MADLEAAVAEAERVAMDPRHGYSQPNRSGVDYDCSSLVCRTLRNAGFDVPDWDFSTRTMGAWLESHGWRWRAGTRGVRRGDVLWKRGHTAWAVSGTRLCEAYIAETGGTHGRPGDQTGSEVRTGVPIGYTAWEGYWRYEEEEVTENDIQRIADLAARKVWEAAEGRETHDRCYRMTSMLKAMCGLGAEYTGDPRAIAGDIRDWTMGRLERCTAMLKALCGIGAGDTDPGSIPTPAPVALSDADVERIAEAVIERMGGEPHR